MIPGGSRVWYNNYVHSALDLFWFWQKDLYDSIALRHPDRLLPLTLGLALACSPFTGSWGPKAFAPH